MREFGWKDTVVCSRIGRAVWESNQYLSLVRMRRLSNERGKERERERALGKRVRASACFGLQADRLVELQPWRADKRNEPKSSVETFRKSGLFIYLKMACLY